MSSDYYRHRPHHWFKYCNRMYGPSRLVWFSIGSIATLAWMHSHQHKDHPFSRIGCGSRTQWERNAPLYGSAAGSYNNQQHQQQQNNASWVGGQGVPNGQQPHDGSIAEALQPSRPVDSMDQERERLRQLGRNAEETVRSPHLGGGVIAGGFPPPIKKDKSY
jgi:hypothetical protein